MARKATSKSPPKPNATPRARVERKRPPWQPVCWVPREVRKVGARYERVDVCERGVDARSAVPVIRLSGEWLQAAGFRIGAYVLITVEAAGQVIFTALSDADPNAKSNAQCGISST